MKTHLEGLFYTVLLLKLLPEVQESQLLSWNDRVVVFRAEKEEVHRFSPASIAETHGWPNNSCGWGRDEAAWTVSGRVDFMILCFRIFTDMI